jgi:3-dehydroquinate dehydratase-2
MKKILVLQGPNLNLLGRREPSLYGPVTLDQLHQVLSARAEASGATVLCNQSNSEAELIEAIQTAPEHNVDFLIFNPGAFAHTSIALRDALLVDKLPFIEVHISNIYAREPFRHHSYLSDIAKGVICGLGTQSYLFALETILQGFN